VEFRSHHCWHVITLVPDDWQYNSIELLVNFALQHLYQVLLTFVTVCSFSLFCHFSSVHSAVIFKQVMDVDLNLPLISMLTVDVCRSVVKDGE